MAAPLVVAAARVAAPVVARGAARGLRAARNWWRRRQQRRRNRDRDEDENCPTCCRIGPYGTLRCPPGQAAHHIVPDMSYRLGPRGTPGRIPNAPTEAEGMAICLTRAQHGTIHPGLEQGLRAASAGNDYVTPMGGILAASIAALNAVPGVDRACKARAAAAATAQTTARPGLGALGRTTGSARVGARTLERLTQQR